MFPRSQLWDRLIEEKNRANESRNSDYGDGELVGGKGRWLGGDVSEQTEQPNQERAPLNEYFEAET